MTEKHSYGKHGALVAHAINRYGTGGHPTAHEKNLHFFGKEYVQKVLKKARKHIKPEYQKDIDSLLKEEEMDREQALNEAHNEDAVRELMLYGDNDRHTYKTSYQPIHNNLEKKVKKGIYDHEKSKKLWGHHARYVAQSYHKQFGSGGKWHHMFSPADRKEAARRWADNWREETSNLKEENMDPITEGIRNIQEGNLEQMRQSFNNALAQKAVEKLEEKKLEIASNYFGIK